MILKSGRGYWVAFIIIALLVTLYIVNVAGVAEDKNDETDAILSGEQSDSDVDGALPDDESENNMDKVIVTTNYGNFEIELFLEESPITAGNFKKLVEEGFYDGTRIHRVIANFMIQGGDPQSKDTANKNIWGTGGPGYAIQDEFIEGLSNVRGTLSMANSGPNSGGSQFFINVVDNTFLDWDKEPSQSKHPVFGKVVSGMDVVDKIVGVETETSDRPVKEVLIEKMEVK